TRADLPRRVTREAPGELGGEHGAELVQPGVARADHLEVPSLEGLELGLEPGELELPLRQAGAEPAQPGRLPAELALPGGGAGVGVAVFGGAMRDEGEGHAGSIRLRLRVGDGCDSAARARGSGPRFRRPPL